MEINLDETILSDIACNANTDIENVRNTYQLFFHDLHDKAKIHDFVPLLAMNQVRQYFRHKPDHEPNIYH